MPDGVATRAEWLAAGGNARMFRDGRLVAVTSTIFALPEALRSIEPWLEERL